MTPRISRRSLLAAVSTASTIGIAGCSDRGTGGPETDGPPRLRVEGRWLTDPDGSPVVLRGVSVVDPARGVERDGDYWGTFRLATDESAGWHARVLRVPVEPRSIDSVGLERYVDDYLDRAVELAAERGVYLLVDYHAVGRYDAPSVDRRLRAFWEHVAPRYADESHVLYELFGEPTEPAAGGIDAWRTWRERATPWVSRVRDDAPETPIVVGSPAWSSMTAYAAEDPFEHDGLLYAARIYPSWEPRSWESAFGAPALDVPVFVTEWGYANVDPGTADHVIATTGSWGEPFREWLDAHENVHWCASTFDAHRQPAMFDADGSLLGGDDHAGELVRGWLADRRADHRPGGSMAIPAGDGEPPDPPAAVGVSRIGESETTIRWNHPRSADDDEILQYRVTVDDRDPEVLRGFERSVTLWELEPDRSYEAAVSAVDAHGLSSEPVTVRFRTPERAAPELVLPRATDPPTVDGDVDEWDPDDGHPLTFFWAQRSIEIGAGWQATWDEDALYVVVGVFEPPDAEWEAAAEVYLDLDNGRESSYDGTNDLQLIVSPADAHVVPGAHSGPVADGVAAETAAIDGGWAAELTVPWLAYGVRPIVGHRFGMDVHVVAEDGDDRIGKIGWFDESDDAWQDPRTFATVELGE